MDYDYVKACVAGYRAVQAYITAVLAYYRHTWEQWGERGRKVGAVKEGKRRGRKRGERKGGFVNGIRMEIGRER